MIELRDIHTGYGGIAVLHGVRLQVAAGRILALLGPNGAGKSTSLRVASGVHRPTAGALVLGGRDVTGASPGTWPAPGSA